jgi:ribosomal protein S18 acetylase RimI-like enzyme
MQPSDVSFRTATDEDAEAVAKVYLLSRRTFVAFAPMAHSEDETRDWIKTVLIPTGRVTVAERNGQIVGMMTLEETDGVGWIEQLYLHPNAVGQGIGSALVARAKAELPSPIRLYTFQENAGAIRFYTRHGFQPIAYGDGSGNEEGCPDVLLEWHAPSR